MLKTRVNMFLILNFKSLNFEYIRASFHATDSLLFTKIEKNEKVS